MSVFNLKSGESARILSVNLSGAAGERLRALGVERGKEVRVLSFSMFKGSVLIGVGYARIALRRSAAQKIEVAKNA